MSGLLNTRGVWMGACVGVFAVLCGACQSPRSDRLTAPVANIVADDSSTSHHHSDDSSTGHHHSESCWIDERGGSDDSQVDMMLFVVGLNHRIGPGGVDANGVRELAGAIKSAWPHPDRVVVLSSAFDTNSCSPSNGVCLKNELELTYPGHRFEIIEVPDHVSGKYGNTGVISGSRWKIGGSEQMFAESNPEQRLVRVFLRDQTTNLVAILHGFHTKDHDAALDELRPIARKAQQVAGGRIAPIFGGDFNMTESSITTESSSFLRNNFLWANHNVPCRSVADLPERVFRTQNGNVMHAFLGRLSVLDANYAYPCSTAEFEPVRYSYSVDIRGNLATRTGDGRNAANEGILLDHIAHNVLGIGLSLRLRNGAPPAQCRSCTCSRPQSAGARCGDVDACGDACKCKEGLECGSSGCRVPYADCEERCNAALTSCLSGCATAPGGDQCTTQCQRANARCMGKCQKSHVFFH